MRIAIIGGGLAGLTAAWLLESTHDVTLLEARERLGGHVASVSVRHRSAFRSVDLGAQDFSTEIFPLHARLLDLLDLNERLIDVAMTQTISTTGTPRPILVTPHAGRAAILGAAWEAVGALVQRAMAWEADDVSWETPYADLVEPLPIEPRLKRTVLYAQPAALYGCSMQQVQEVSARAATAIFTRSPAPPAGQAPTWQNLDGGLHTLIQSLAADLQHARLRVAARVVTIAKRSDAYALTIDGGETYHADHVVMAVPPPAGLPLTRQLAGTAELNRALAHYRYLPCTTGVHQDPCYMPATRSHWSTSNLIVNGDFATSSAWYRPINGADLFKSQLTHRTYLPERLLAIAHFTQMLPDASAVRGHRALAKHQGRDGLWFAGHYVSDLDCQETAVRSAADIARVLAPSTRRLHALLTDTPPEPDRTAVAQTPVTEGSP
ncbi:protoporphyrinogen/coproporphyrinogen oxidase [Actinomadura rubrisoli]|uniref:FAD-dependent oxidoreductase n=1 Tax=Actinomadura rubrisoli TaxID=2530368 RepID=A0A4R5ALQ9_9ACTN|nr:FAD-dependent oxidoreductase [Actinomadura rubrisoli]TDD73671.1 FAD-dependent oxidoreductase [Actinomadura rubrisoli]